MDRGKRGKRRITEMLTSVIEWHDASVELPTESGEYFACTASGMVTHLGYSQKYKAFNVQDWYNEDEIEEYIIKVRYWADKLVLPENESEGV
jgi:hypothetical protein